MSCVYYIVNKTIANVVVPRQDVIRTEFWFVKRLFGRMILRISKGGSLPRPRTSATENQEWGFFGEADTPTLSSAFELSSNRESDLARRADCPIAHELWPKLGIRVSPRTVRYYSAPQFLIFDRGANQAGRNSGEGPPIGARP